MKKFLAMTLALIMMTSMVAVAVAAEVTRNGGTNEAAVTGTCEAGISSPEVVYSVDISWENLDFTYYEASSATWDPENHVYKNDAREAGWDANDVGTATITNHSNTAILATFSYSAETNYESADMQFLSDEVYIASAETDNQAETASNTVKPTGTLPKGTENATIGTITITIAQALMGSDEASGEANLIFSEAEDYLRGNRGYKVVDNAAEVATGEKYILKNEITSIVAWIADDMLPNISNSSDEEATAMYYEVKEAWDTFKATKLYTKA